MGMTDGEGEAWLRGNNFRPSGDDGIDRLRWEREVVNGNEPEDDGYYDRIRNSSEEW
jgi:hypothetical protein